MSGWSLAGSALASLKKGSLVVLLRRTIERPEGRGIVAQGRMILTAAPRRSQTKGRQPRQLLKILLAEDNPGDVQLLMVLLTCPAVVPCQARDRWGEGAVISRGATDTELPDIVLLT